ncbi:hypothetical protein TKK_0000386 [Trichogramma kaykai]|uniref:FAM69 protein-kinase domain-containing protein n=1 Tax=Trichogramma kaykai TaxID=54128 RepID=A0ABD2VX05_9HYME
MLSWRAKIASIVFAVCALTLALDWVNEHLNPRVVSLTEKERCPLCFGTSACPAIENNEVVLEYPDFYSIFNNLFGVKNVYYGNFRNRKVVIKKLAHQSEWIDFNKQVCADPTLSQFCSTNSKESSKVPIDFNKMVMKELSNPDLTDLHQKMRLCPTVSNVDKLLRNVETSHLRSKENQMHEHFAHVWSALMINPEFLMVQILNADNHWPTPKFYGACGRLIIEENAGDPLLNFIKESWIKRAKIASSLLDAAYKFTFKDPNFAFYLTDIATDNIAINEKLEAIFVDLENIIIVDKTPPIDVLNRLSDWNTTYANLIGIDSDCPDCFVFSPDDICTHRISDHNYYAVCQHILSQGLNAEINSQGFLYDPPDYILKKYPSIQSLLQQCSVPSATMSRVNAGIKLKQILDQIIKDTSNIF